MKGLKCKTINCEHNHGYHCTAGVINISPKASCNSKMKREYGIISAELEAGEEFDYAENEDVLIQCDCTKCSYNKQNLCNSDLVNLSEKMFKTKCNTRQING